MIRRYINQEIAAALKDTPVVLLNGARQTGKTTLLKELAASTGASYFTLDDAGTHAAASLDPQGFICNIRGRVAIDEVQKAPGLFPAIKLAVDNDRAPGRFLLTGSSNVLTLPKISESLAGRMQIVRLFPFAQAELKESGRNIVDLLFSEGPIPPVSTGLSGADLAELIMRGGFPEAVAREDAQRRDAWFSSYITTIIQRDLRDIANLEGLVQLPTLLKIVASRAAGLLNAADISRTAGIPNTTLNRYLAFLEMIFLIKRLAAWHINPGKRLVKAPKIHICDSGLACHLAGVSGNFREGNLLKGPMFESFVLSELEKQGSWSSVRPEFFHARTASGAEVDIVMEDRLGRVVGIEVKASAAVSAGDFRGLTVLGDLAEGRMLRQVVVYAGETMIPFGSGRFALPVGMLWSLAS